MWYFHLVCLHLSMLYVCLVLSNTYILTIYILHTSQTNQTNYPPTSLINSPPEAVHKKGPDLQIYVPIIGLPLMLHLDILRHLHSHAFYSESRSFINILFLYTGPSPNVCHPVPDHRDSCQTNARQPSAENVGEGISDMDPIGLAPRPAICACTKL